MRICSATVSSLTLAGLLLVGCNSLPSTGRCDVPGAGSVSPPQAEPVALGGRQASFDDLRFAPSLGLVLAVPEGEGAVYLVEPDTAAVTRIPGLPPGAASADAGDGYLFVAERGERRIVMVEATTRQVAGSVPLDTTPDYVRFSAATHEVWVTEPGAGRIEVLAFARQSPAATARVAYIEVGGGPEGLAFDSGRGRAYAHTRAELAVIDVAARRVLTTWGTGCGSSHGIPVVDEARGLVLAGCRSSGGGVLLRTSDGQRASGYEAGGGAAILALSTTLHHVYLRGDPGTQVAILGACADGGMGLLARVEAAEVGHGMAADDRGSVWVADATRGGLLRIRDPFPAAP